MNKLKDVIIQITLKCLVSKGKQESKCVPTL